MGDSDMLYFSSYMCNLNIRLSCNKLWHINQQNEEKTLDVVTYPTSCPLVYHTTIWKMDNCNMTQAISDQGVKCLETPLAFL